MTFWSFRLELSCSKIIILILCCYKFVFYSTVSSKIILDISRFQTEGIIYFVTIVRWFSCMHNSRLIMSHYQIKTDQNFLLYYNNWLSKRLDVEDDNFFTQLSFNVKIRQLLWVVKIILGMYFVFVLCGQLL